MTNLPPLPPLPPRPSQMGASSVPQPQRPVSLPAAPMASPVPLAQPQAPVYQQNPVNIASQAGYAAMSEQQAAVSTSASLNQTYAQTPANNGGEQTIWDGAKKFFGIYAGVGVAITAVLWPYMVFLRGESPAVATMASIIVLAIVLGLALFLSTKLKPVTVNWNDGTLTIGKDEPKPLAELNYFIFNSANNGVAIAIGFGKSDSMRNLGGVIKPKQGELDVLENILRYSGLPEGTQGDGFNPKTPWYKQDAINAVRSLSGKPPVS